MTPYVLAAALALTAVMAGWFKCIERRRPTRAGWLVIGAVVILTMLSTFNARRQQQESDSQLTAVRKSNLDLLAANQALRDDVAEFENLLKEAINVLQFRVNPERVEFTSDDRSAYRSSLEAIEGLLNQRDSELMSSLSAPLASPEEAIGTLIQEPESTVNAIVSNSQECRDLLQRTSSYEAGRRMLATLVEGELAFVASVTGNGGANVGLMAGSDWDLSRGFELQLGNRIIQVEPDRCGGPTSRMCRVSVDLRDIDGWESDFLTTLASSELQRVTVLSDPQRRVSLKPSTASRIQQALRCVGAN